LSYPENTLRAMDGQRLYAGKAYLRWRASVLVVVIVLLATPKYVASQSSDELERPFGTTMSWLQIDPKLEDGLLETVFPATVDVGMTFEVKAIVCGRTFNCTYATDKVKIGALVRTWIAVDPRLKIIVDGSSTQPVISGDVARWVWLVEPSKPGIYKIYIYSQPRTSDGEVLAPDTLVDYKTIEVRATPGYGFDTAMKRVGEFLTSLNGLLTACGVSMATILVYVWNRLVRRKKPRTKTASAK
jgi:hypothetical protein